MNLKTVIFSFITILVTTESSLAEEQEVYFEQGNKIETDKSVKIPNQLTKIIEESFVKEFKKFDPVRASVVSRADIMSKSDKKYFDIKVYLNDKNKGSLKSPVVFDMSRGGGIIDLRD